MVVWCFLIVAMPCKMEFTSRTCPEPGPGFVIRGEKWDGSRLRRVRIADIQDAFFWSQDGRNTWLLLYVSFLPMNQAKKIGLVSAKVFMCKIPVLGFPGVRPEDTLLEVRDLVETIHVELANEGSKVLVFEPPGKYFAREAFMIKDY